jgi:hypothetical protein
VHDDTVAETRQSYCQQDDFRHDFPEMSFGLEGQVLWKSRAGRIEAGRIDN